MKWIHVTEAVPETLPINYDTEMSWPLLLWLKDDTFTKGWMIRDLDKRNGNTIRWVNEVDITRMVTHWCRDIPKPTDAPTVKVFNCRNSMIANKMEIIPRSCPTCGISNKCKYDIPAKT